MPTDKKRDPAPASRPQGRTDDPRTHGDASTGRERSGKPSSQGLAGAQGSGGGAERGVEQPPPKRRVATDESSSIRDNAGIRPDEGTDGGD